MRQIYKDVEYEDAIEHRRYFPSQEQIISSRWKRRERVQALENSVRAEHYTICARLGLLGCHKITSQ